MNLLIVIGLPVVLILILWLFAIAPKAFKGPPRDHFVSYDYAHRGLHNDQRGIPENSLAAFRTAAQSGFGIELDVQLTRDHQVVVFHDENLKRVCGVDAKVGALTLSQLRQYRLLNTKEGIPTLRQALMSVGGRTPVIVELKSYDAPGLLCSRVSEILDDYQGRSCIQSFNPSIVKWFQDHRPDILRGQLMMHIEETEQLSKFQAFLGRNLFSNFMTRPHFVAYDYHTRNVPSMWLAKTVLGLQEVSWTVTDLQTYRRLKARNCVIIFEGFEPYRETKAVPVPPVPTAAKT